MKAFSGTTDASNGSAGKRAKDVSLQRKEKIQKAKGNRKMNLKSFFFNLCSKSNDIRCSKNQFIFNKRVGTGNEYAYFVMSAAFVR